jgi:hypothetical protein
VTDKPRRGQQGRKFSDAELAAILAFAKLNGNEKAARRFKLALRSIERHWSRVRNGRAPELAALVEQHASEAARKSADLLAETLEKTLRRIQKLLPDASITECTKVAETLGDLTIQRDFIGGDDAGSKDRRKDQTPRAPAGRGGGAESAPADTTVQ